MTDVRVVQRISAPEPVQSTHLATKNYVDQALIAQAEDSARYGDALSSARRDQISNQSSLANGFWTFSSAIAARVFTATKVRFFVAAAGAVAASPTVALSLYDNGTQVATAPVTSTTFTSVGVKEFDLSATVPAIVGHRYTFLLYVAASSYITAPALGFTAAYYSGLASPTAALTFNGYKAGASAPPSSITTSDGTWSAHPATLWWALL